MVSHLWCILLFSSWLTDWMIDWLNECYDIVLSCWLDVITIITFCSRDSMLLWQLCNHVCCNCYVKLFCFAGLAVLQMLQSNQLPSNIPHQCLLDIADTVEHSMGGCSGAVSSSLCFVINILAPSTSDSAFADIVCIYKFHLLIYLFSPCKNIDD